MFRINFKYTGRETVIGFLTGRLASGDWERLADLFQRGCILMEGHPVSADTVPGCGSDIVVCLPEHHEEPADTCWQLIWEHEELMVVYKPHQLPVSRTTRNLYNTLISLIRRETEYSDARLLHRLDTETAGLVVIAKNACSDRKWKPRLNELISQKIYHAWVSGDPAWDEQRLDCYLYERSDSPVRSQVYVSSDEVTGRKCRFSSTSFQVIDRKEGRALIRCELHTGRKHQIRAHLAHLGYPVIGDKIYSHQGRYYLKRISQGLDLRDYELLGSDYHLLEAVSLTLNLDAGPPLKISIPDLESGG